MRSDHKNVNAIEKVKVRKIWQIWITLNTYMKFDEQIFNNFFETELNTTKNIVKSMSYGRSKSEIDDQVELFSPTFLFEEWWKNIFFFKLQSVMDEQGQMRDKDGLYMLQPYTWWSINKKNQFGVLYNPVFHFLSIKHHKCYSK